MRARRSLAVLTALVVLLTACGGSSSDRTSGTADPGGQADPTSPGSSRTEFDPADLGQADVVTGLDTIWALAFGPDGSLWFTERKGRIGHMVLRPDGSYSRPEFEEVAGVVERGEGGLMGLAIDGEGRRFVMFTSDSGNRVVELRPDGTQRLLVGGIEAGTIHNGGRLAIGPDGSLYAATGDAGDRSLPRRDGLNGRILRIEPDSAQVAVVSTGHRNPQGLCFDGDGRLLSTEHGPDRGDEVNLIEAGRDYGWPETEGTGIFNWTPTIAPAGCVVYRGGAFPELRGTMLLTTLKARSLRRLELAGDRLSARELEPLVSGSLGRLRDVAVGPQGDLFVATSNRDGRGDPSPGDDRIVRLFPSG